MVDYCILHGPAFGYYSSIDGMMVRRKEGRCKIDTESFNTDRLILHATLKCICLVWRYAYALGRSTVYGSESFYSSQYKSLRMHANFNENKNISPGYMVSYYLSAGSETTGGDLGAIWAEYCFLCEAIPLNGFQPTQEAGGVICKESIAFALHEKQVMEGFQEFKAP